MAYYEVVSDHIVLGHEPGEVFEAELDEAQELLLGIGHLAEVAAPHEDAPDDAPPAAQTEEV